MPSLPDGPVEHTYHSPDRLRHHVGLRHLCRPPANASPSRPLFLPSIHTSSSVRPGLNLFSVYCIPWVGHTFYTQGACYGRRSLVGARKPEYQRRAAAPRSACFFPQNMDLTVMRLRCFWILAAAGT